MPSNGREITNLQAINEALCEEMERDEKVILIGEDVASASGVFKVTDGILDKFGPERIIDSPISEAGITGLGVGAAMTGMRPIVEIMFCDFLTLVMDSLVNQAAKTHYMSGGNYQVPIVIRTLMGAGRRAAAQHSQSLQAWFAHIPGLKVMLPSSPYDAKGLLKTAIRDNNPVIFFEDKMNYQTKGMVPDPAEEYTIPFGKADIKRAGEDITLIATSSMVLVALEAAIKLKEGGVSAEVIDLRSITPIDEEKLVESAMKTSRCIVIDEGYQSFGITAEVASVINEKAFYFLDSPVRRIGAMDVPVPFSPILEDQTIPDVEGIVKTAKQLLGN